MSKDLVQCLDPPSLGPPHPSDVFSNLTVVPMGDMNFVTIAGQVGSTPEGTVPSTLEEQVEVCLSRMDKCLEAVNGTVFHITRFAYYMAEHDPDTTVDRVVKIVHPWLQGHKPASCYLVVKALSEPQFKCEFEAQAIIPRK